MRENIQSMVGYVPGEQPQDGVYIKLNTNENPYPPSPKIKEFLINNFDYEKLRLYPDPVFFSLRKKISEVYSINKENIFVGNGSDEVLTVITRCFVDSNDIIALPYPSYSLYEVLSAIQGCKNIKINFDENYDLSVEEVVSSKAKIFFIANPNSPSGTVLKKEKIEEIIKKFDGIVVVDEAYADFADYSCSSLVNKYNNLIVTRTLSKSFSLAGIRIGYAFASKKIIDAMFKVKDSYNINMLSQKIAEMAFDDMLYMKTNTEEIKKTRIFTVDGLKSMGFKIFPSQANFLFASHDIINGDLLYKILKDKGFLVRYFDDKRLRHGIRITIGKKEDMEGFLNVTREIINKA
ncbi:histidinol-phosphate transaminase [bacterium]|nr:histidinol-phosphate transaminase [bacterium]